MLDLESGHKGVDVEAKLHSNKASRRILYVKSVEHSERARLQSYRLARCMG